MTLRPPRLVKALGFPVICAAMFVVLGGHWALLQAVAWSQMAVSYSRDAQSVATGLKKTFSGEYPCGMCKKIAEAKKQEERSDAIFKADKKVETFLAQPGWMLHGPQAQRFSYFEKADSDFPSRSERPSPPVPIFA